MASLKLTQETAVKLDRIMSQLEIPSTKRAEAYRLAFAKGIDSVRDIDPDIKMGKMYEFKSSILYTFLEESVIKHLIISKLGKPIYEYDLDKLILSIITNGINDMHNELNILTDADNYLFYLFEKHKNKTI